MIGQHVAVMILMMTHSPAGPTSRGRRARSSSLALRGAHLACRTNKEEVNDSLKLLPHTKSEVMQYVVLLAMLAKTLPVEPTEERGGQKVPCDRVADSSEHPI